MRAQGGAIDRARKEMLGGETMNCIRLWQIIGKLVEKRRRKEEEEKKNCGCERQFPMDRKC